MIDPILLGKMTKTEIERMRDRETRRHSENGKDRYGKRDMEREG